MFNIHDKKPNKGNPHTIKGGAQWSGPSRTYDDATINELLQGYIKVPRELWDNIPIGAHIRYINKPTQGKTELYDRFKPGGFVKNRWEKDNKKMIQLENTPSNNRSVSQHNNRNYITFAINQDNVSEIYKRYDYNSYIENMLINNSLIQLNKKISDLTKTINALKKQ